MSVLSRASRHIWLIVAAVLAILVASTAVVVASVKSDPVPHDHSDPTVAHDHHHPVSDEPVVLDHDTPQVGDPVRVGNLEFTVTDVETGVSAIHGKDEFSVTPHGSYTLVKMTVANVSAKPQSYYSDNISGVVDGEQIASDSVAVWYANEGDDDWLNEIKPGDSITTVVVFDVPAGSELAGVVLRDTAASTGMPVALVEEHGH